MIAAYASHKKYTWNLAKQHHLNTTSKFFGSEATILAMKMFVGPKSP